MKKYAIIVFTILLLPTEMFAEQWYQRALGDLLADADLVVIGSILADSGIAQSPPSEGSESLLRTWDSQLRASRVLKGHVTTKTVRVVWDEINISGIPPYQLGESRIWILKVVPGTTTYSTIGRPDTVLLMNQLKYVEDELKK